MNTALQLEKVAPERNYHRELDISLRHRCWGIGVPAVGLNYIEVDRYGMPVAVVTYHRKQNPWPTMQFTFKVHSNVAEKMCVPHFYVMYDFNVPTPTFFIKACNSRAKSHVLVDGNLTEPMLTRLLHRLRGIQLYSNDATIQEEINNRWETIRK
jgi:hypothetical protein